MPTATAITPPERDGFRVAVLAVLALLTFTAGYFGQGSWPIGGRAEPPAISAIATDVAGGPGSRQPIRIQVTIAVSNDGVDPIQVIDPAESTAGVTVVALDPPVLTVAGGQVARLNADIALHCDQATVLALPALRVELSDGVDRRLEVGGSGVLLDACSRGVPRARPLAVSLVPTPPDPTPPNPTGKTDPTGKQAIRTPSDQLTIKISSPTGRRTVVTAIRGGGVDLVATPLPVTVGRPAAASSGSSGSASTTVQLTAPRSCPMQWRVIGVPNALVFDLAPGSAAGPLTSAQVRIGPDLTSWLLATSCREA